MQNYFAAWPQEGTVDLFEKIAELIIMTASRTLMGVCRRTATIFFIALSTEQMRTGQQLHNVSAWCAHVGMHIDWQSLSCHVGLLYTCSEHVVVSAKLACSLETHDCT